MKTRTFAIATTLVTVIAIFLSTATFSPSSHVKAQTKLESRIEQGFDIAPVPLNVEGKDRALVGLGSYLVNAAGGCNDCHSAGPQSQYLQGGSPYFGQPTRINPAVYLGGGRDFGALLPTPGSPHIVSRNLTPDRTGLPAGGRSFDQFREILKTGVDLDHLHPPYSTGQTTNCIPPPFDGNKLQVMTWPVYQNLTEHDIRAIYEYLSAVPCIDGPPAPSVLHNDCH